MGATKKESKKTKTKEVRYGGVGRVTSSISNGTGLLQESIKAIRHLNKEQVHAVQKSMLGLVGEVNDDTTLRSLNDHFGVLKDAGLVSAPRFSRTTGEPKLKKVLTKKGRDVFKFLFPKDKSAAPAIVD